jgi:glycosyltransferase involved in cell wall biosynthesis
MSPHIPKVSIGLPVYNGELLVCKAIEAMLAQTFQDFELIIADNASTDNTQQVCEAYAAQDPRIRYHRNPENVGLARNHDRVLELATGQYFKVLHADDGYAPNYLERCVQVLDADPETVLAYAETIGIDEHDVEVGPKPANLHARSPYPQKRFQQFLEALYDYQGSHPFNALFGVIRTEALRKTSWHGKFISADSIFIAELLLLGKFHEIPEPLFFRRSHTHRSLTANPAFDRLVRVLDPMKTDKFVFPHWRLLIEFTRAIGRHPLSWAARLGCYNQLWHWIWWKKRVLWREFVINSARALNWKALPFADGQQSLPTQWY